MIDRIAFGIVAAGLLTGLLAGVAPATAQELKVAPLDRKALTAQGFEDPALALILNTKGEMVGALTETPAGEKTIPPSTLPQSLANIRGLGSTAIRAFQGSDCYVVRRPDGTLYVMPPGCH